MSVVLCLLEQTLNLTYCIRSSVLFLHIRLQMQKDIPNAGHGWNNRNPLANTHIHKDTGGYAHIFSLMTTQNNNVIILRKCRGEHARARKQRLAQYTHTHTQVSVTLLS